MYPNDLTKVDEEREIQNELLKEYLTLRSNFI
jgi:hypothetical protein